jgi:hypothetical protein
MRYVNRALFLLGIIAIAGTVMLRPSIRKVNPTPQPYHATPVNLGPYDPVVTT